MISTEFIRKDFCISISFKANYFTILCKFTKTIKFQDVRLKEDNEEEKFFSVI